MPSPSADETGDDVPAVTGPSGQPVTLADTDADLEVHGRIGYGTRTPWFLGGLLVLVVVAIGFTSFLNGRDEDDSGIADMAPAFEMMLFDGSTFRLEDHRGQVVVLNFWASWCPPCRAEAPNLIEVANTTKASGVEFIGVNVKNAKDEALAFERKQGVPYPSLHDQPGVLLTRFRKIVPQVPPTTLVLDRKGRIAGVFIGGVTTRELLVPVQALAAEPA